MARYTPITNIMPLASMVTGAPVTSALGDQLRDNLVALYDGWWFRATRAASFTSVAASYATMGLDTITLSQSAEDDGRISLSSNAVLISKPGQWLVGAHYTTSTNDTMTVAVTSTSVANSYVCESGADNTNNKTDICCSGAMAVATTATVNIAYYTQLASTITTNSRSPILWGVWMGDPP